MRLNNEPGLIVPGDHNRLEIDARKFDGETKSESHTFDIRDMTLAMQCLPLAMDEVLELSITDPTGKGMEWYVVRKDELTYRFICRSMSVCGDFKVGDVDDDHAVKTKLGWYDIQLANDPRLKGSGLENHVWMGDEISTFVGGMMVLFYKSVDRLRLYPFISNPRTQLDQIKSLSKRKKAERQSNIVTYLGRPPGSSPKANVDDESLPREFGYPRRQHRRTLRSERFKNHPKFGVYKGVLVSQSWCGPKEYIHKRKIYRLWEPPAIDTTG